MKKIALLLVILSFAFTSCKKAKNAELSAAITTKVDVSYASWTTIDYSAAYDEINSDTKYEFLTSGKDVLYKWEFFDKYNNPVSGYHKWHQSPTINSYSGYLYLDTSYYGNFTVKLTVSLSKKDKVYVQEQEYKTVYIERRKPVLTNGQHTYYEMSNAVQCNSNTLQNQRCQNRTKNSCGHCWQHH